jgi:exopolysaccharide biosynthesis polyprenyl glycosylphosphotransferase
VPPTSAAAPSASSPPLRRLLVVVDIAAVLAAWIVAVALADLFFQRTTSPGSWVLGTLLVAGSGSALAAGVGLYRREVAAVRSVELSRIASTVAGLVVVAGVLRFPAGGEVALLTAGIAAVGWSMLLTAERGLFRAWITSRRAAGDFHAPVLVMAGDLEDAVETGDFLTANPVLGFEVRGVATQDDVLRTDAFRSGEGEAAAQMVRSAGATGVVIDSRGLTGNELNQLVQDAGAGGLHVHLSSGLRGVTERRVTVSPLADETFLHIAPLGLRSTQLVLKRITDVVLGTVAAVVFSPVLAAAALATWLGDRGPVLFRQDRVGLNGETFTLYKLRTMVVDAEAQRDALEQDNQRDGPLFKVAGDPRITPLGRLFRATSIDEIPQLLNVLSGSMSLVGPRPALLSEYELFDAVLRRRVAVKPGITGFWQVEARDAPSFELYRRYDLLYVQNWSVGLDLSIIARTFAVVGLRGVRALVQIGRRGSDHVLD